MKIEWIIETADVAKVNSFFLQHKDRAFVQKRIATNLRRQEHAVTIGRFWQAMVSCLLTTQQRSGPASAVTRFIMTRPFPLAYGNCRRHKSLASSASQTIASFGGLRRSLTIGREVAENAEYLQDNWQDILEVLEAVRKKPRPETERQAARFLAEHLAGFGPKQSRNLLQGLGLSRHEVPIDSRITKWLNDFGFPVRLTAAALSDPAYFEFVSDGFQRLASASGIVPCVLDAAIFSRLDGDAWTKENMAW